MLMIQARKQSPWASWHINPSVWVGSWMPPHYCFSGDLRCKNTWGEVTQLTFGVWLWYVWCAGMPFKTHTTGRKLLVVPETLAKNKQKIFHDKKEPWYATKLAFGGQTLKAFVVTWWHAEQKETRIDKPTKAVIATIKREAWILTK